MITYDPASLDNLRERAKHAQDYANMAARAAGEADMIAVHFERAATARRKRAIIAQEKANQAQAKASQAAALVERAANAGDLTTYNDLALDIMRLMQSAHNYSLAAADMAHADPYKNI